MLSIYAPGVTIGFVSTLYSVNENDEIAALAIAVLSGQLSEEVVVRLSTENGSATGIGLAII